MAYILLFTGLVCVLLMGAPLAALATEAPGRQSFVHPGMLHTSEDLATIRELVEAGEEPWRTAWEQLRDGRPSSLEFQPEPRTHVIRGPYGRPSIGDRELSRSARAAHSHALLWAISGNRAHAEKAIEILNAWSGVLWDFQLNDAKLLAAWTGDSFCNAAEILRHTDSGWEEGDVEQFTRLMLTVYYPLLENFFPEANGNWDAAIINTMLCIGVFCDNRGVFDRAVEHFMRGRGNGGITKYVYPSGQCQESTRDQSHTQMGLGEFALACRVAQSQGVDLYGAADNRLALGFEYTARYMLGDDVPAYGDVSEQGRRRLRDIYESVYQHYHYGRGLEMPYTGRAIARTRGGRRSGSALTMHRGPLPDPPRSAGPPSPSTQAPEAGARPTPTANPPTDAISVAPGEDVQSALDSCSAGGWVVLARGVHTLTDTLKIPSRITLSGQGLETILWLDPERTGPTLVNATPDLHDVTLRDLVVEGATSCETPNDPNSQRRRRSYQHAPSRAGIVLSALRAGQMRNLRLEHVTVRNCAHDGVAIRGATNVAIHSCDFSDSGGSVVPGPGLQHNLLLARSSKCEVRGSRFDTSLWGSGIDVSHCQDVSLHNNEAARNALHGIRATESTNVCVTGNLVEGNDGSGILLDALMDGCRGTEVRANLARNNGGYGIDVVHHGEGVVVDNTAKDNGHVEQIRVGQRGE